MRKFTGGRERKRAKIVGEGGRDRKNQLRSIFSPFIIILYLFKNNNSIRQFSPYWKC